MTVHPDPTGSFDPDAAAGGEGSLFGLPEHPSPLIEVLPAAYEATTSYRTGTAGGPAAIAEASLQVDLDDARFGQIWTVGIGSLQGPEGLEAIGQQASELARPIIERGGATDSDAAEVAKIDALAERATALIRESVAAILARDRVPALLGGEHAVSLGAIEAVSAAHPGVGVLQIDAHLDLRDRFEGFEHSHASVMFNALRRAEGLASITAVGIRDHGTAEREMAERDPRVRVFTDDALADELAAGRTFANWCDEVLATLPERVYVSFDIDGLDPSLCPSTGTPVPGGFSWQQISVLLGKLAESDRKVVGFDLVEVGTEQAIDAIVGARLLYRLCGVVARQHSATG